MCDAAAAGIVLSSSITAFSTSLNFEGGRSSAINVGYNGSSNKHVHLVYVADYLLEVDCHIRVLFFH